MIYPNKFRIIHSLSELTNQDEGLFYYISEANPPAVIEDMRKAIKEMLERNNPIPAGPHRGRIDHMTVSKGNLRREERERYYLAHVNSLKYIAGALVAWGQEVRMHDERINKITDVAVLLNVLDAFVNEVVNEEVVHWSLNTHTNTNKVLKKLQEERFLYDYNLTTSNILSLSIKVGSTDEHISWKLTKAQAILWVEYLKFLFIDDWTPPPNIEFLTTEEMKL